MVSMNILANSIWVEAVMHCVHFGMILAPKRPCTPAMPISFTQWHNCTKHIGNRRRDKTYESTCLIRIPYFCTKPRSFDVSSSKNEIDTNVRLRIKKSCFEHKNIFKKTTPRSPLRLSVQRNRSAKERVADHEDESWLVESVRLLSTHRWLTSRVQRQRPSKWE